MMEIDREQLARVAFWDGHPMLMILLEHWHGSTEMTLRACIDLVQRLSDAQLSDLVARGVIPDPALEPVAAEEVPAELLSDPAQDASGDELPITLQPWHRTIQAGDQVVVEDPDSGLLSYGQIEAGAGDVPWLASGRWHSVACPQGKAGDHHRSRIAMRLQGDEFAQMEAAGWPETWDELLALLWPVAS